MPNYFGHELNQQEMDSQILADDLALVFVRAHEADERKWVLDQIEAAGVPWGMWDKTVERARRYIEG